MSLPKPNRNSGKHFSAMKKHFSIIILALLLLTAFSHRLPAQQADIDKAGKAYMAGFYENAITLYEKLLSQEQASPEIYYNLGNAYFKTGNMPSAILNYERALKYRPNDEDILYNLGVANSRIVDKIDVLPELFYIRWWKSLKQLLSPDGWAVALIASFSLFFIVLALFLLSRSAAIRKALFSSAIVVLVVALISGTIAWQTYHEARQQVTAIVFTPTLPVKSSPDESSIDLFVIHEGLKVKIIDKLGEWNEISIPNGSKGWVKISDLKPI